MKQNLHTKGIEKHALGMFLLVVTVLRKFEGAEFQTSCFHHAICGYLALF